MRKLLALAFAILLSPLSAWATFGSATAWDVRTTGTNTNGGGFDSGVGSPGTDESQGSGTAITITLATGTTGTGSPAFTSTTHGPGNFVHIASGSGCTPGWYEVLSQAAGVATFDSTMGSATDVCVGVVGGSLSTIAQASSLVFSKNTIWVKSGTYTLTSVTSFSTSANFTIVGYGSTHGDITSVCAVATTCPLITTATNSTVLFEFSANVSVAFQNVLMSNTAGTPAQCVYSDSSAAEVFVDNAKFTGCSIAIDGESTEQFRSVTVHNCEITGSTVSAIEEYGSLSIDSCYIHGNTSTSTVGAVGQYLNQVTTSITHTIIVNNTGPGFVQNQANGVLSFVNDVFYKNSGDNINFQAANNSVFIEDTVIYGSGGYGINQLTNAQANWFLYNNGYGDNTSGNFNIPANTAATGTFTNAGAVSLSADPFVNGSSGNFALNSTSGGGAALKAAGTPGVFPGNTTTGYPDVGAAQSQGSSGSSGPYGSIN
jgi:hypothetical protein